MCSYGCFRCVHMPTGCRLLPIWQVCTDCCIARMVCTTSLQAGPAVHHSAGSWGMSVKQQQQQPTPANVGLQAGGLVCV
jgi:hypothetical protein